ncbi:MAG: phytanoyl-CoA dioxygenase family protein [Gammaproteobacteria bacterium]|nr:phytanoyl-CoA dioxygenase family protein [Gammaproteobacteria bacterium]MCZ6797147.1 phytanoyl-CoA dioxygenase family protein [Gammaproteobacteria bacterium]
MSYSAQYNDQGYLSGIDIINADEVAEHRSQLENAEQQIGSMHYLAKVHTILTSPAKLVSHPRILDIVEQLIGPDILVYNATYIIKEANAKSYVSWHQDLTYWGLDSDEQISVWLALSDASESSGCMRMIPGSHRLGRQPHILGEGDDNNVLFQSQRVADVDESQAVAAELKPGQASFHHGWLLHASSPNASADRRIGLNIQYIAPHVRQTKLPGYTALLARGVDQYRHYEEDVAATSDLDSGAMRRRNELERLNRDIAGRA